MELNAVKKAQARLVRAKEALAQVEASTSYSAFQRAWEEFLAALYGIHSVLLPGAKSNPTSRQWYGQIKSFRAKDPLLNYLYQARGAEEHGLEPITVHKPSRIGVGGLPGAVVEIEEMIIVGDRITKLELAKNSAPAIIEIRPSTAVLVTVKDSRFPDQFHPPTEHLGKPLQDAGPLAVGTLGYQYYEALVAEAAVIAMKTSSTTSSSRSP